MDQIQKTAASLGLRWDAAIVQSYQVLFETVKTALNLKFHDLSHENFAGIEVKPEHLGVVPADVDV